MNKEIINEKETDFCRCSIHISSNPISISEVAVKNIGKHVAQNVRLEINPQLVRDISNVTDPYLKCPNFLDKGAESLLPGEEIRMKIDNSATPKLESYLDVKLSYERGINKINRECSSRIDLVKMKTECGDTIVKSWLKFIPL